MSDTVVIERLEVRAPLPLEQPTTPLRGRSFAATLHAKREPEPVIEVLEAVETDFRQGEASVLQVINAALAKDGMSRQQLLTLRARMKRYSLEVNVLANLLQALVRDLKERDALGVQPPA